MQISFVIPIFLLFSDQISKEAKVSEGGKLPQGVPPAPVEESQVTGMYAQASASDLGSSS